MATNVSEMEAFRKLRQTNAGMPQALQGGGGDGTSGDMESRIVRLETLIDPLRGVPEKLARLEERVAHLPGKGFIVTASLGTIGGIVALFGMLQKVGILH